jgi:predicted nucleic acid-binding protein
VTPPLYVESSALLRVVLDDDEITRAVLESAPALLYASDLTFLEAARGLTRARAERRLNGAALRRVTRELLMLERQVELVGIGPEVLRLAREPFPVGPVRSLDAIHLATIRLLADGGESVRVATYDRRIRANLDALGIPLAPGLDA